MLTTSRPRPRRLLAVSTLMSLGLLSACGGGDDSAASSATSSLPTAPTSTAPTTVTLAPVTAAPSTVAPPESTDGESSPSTYTIVAGDSLYAIAEQADVSLDDLVAANGWSDGIDHLILPGDVIKLPTAGSEPSGDGGTTENATGGGYGPATSGLTISGGRTDPIADPLADGLYFSDDYTSDGSTVTFTLTQYFICDSAANVPADVWADCASGFGTLQDPSARVDLASNASVTIATGDSDNTTRADVTVAEFARLVSGAAPGADAPSGYEFLPWLAWAKVENGSVVAVEQFYTS